MSAASLIAFGTPPLTPGWVATSSMPPITRPSPARATENVRATPAICAVYEPDWLVRMHSAMARIANLREGWDGPGSVPIPVRLIYLADRIARDALQAARAPIAPFV